MAPASIVVRLTNSLVAGYATYGFKPDKRNPGEYTFPEVIDGILHEPTPDYLGKEFYLGGKLVKEMAPETTKRLQERGVTLERDPRRLLDIIADKALKG
jgi:CRISPR-associated protein Cst2